MEKIFVSKKVGACEVYGYEVEVINDVWRDLERRDHSGQEMIFLAITAEEVFSVYYYQEAGWRKKPLAVAVMGVDGVNSATMYLQNDMYLVGDKTTDLSSMMNFLKGKSDYRRLMKKYTGGD